MTHFPQNLQDVPKTDQGKISLLIVEFGELVRTMREIENTLRDVHAVLETISRNVK
jgi:hypothetical protein